MANTGEEGWALHCPFCEEWSFSPGQAAPTACPKCHMPLAGAETYHRPVPVAHKPSALEWWDERLEHLDDDPRTFDDVLAGQNAPGRPEPLSTSALLVELQHDTRHRGAWALVSGYVHRLWTGRGRAHQEAAAVRPLPEERTPESALRADR